MELHILLVVLSLVTVVVQVNGAAPYTVNNQKKGCPSDSFLGFETGSLDVIRGSRGAPCVGYLTFPVRVPGTFLKTKRICTDTGEDAFFYKEAAKRVCWTLGNNFFRDPITNEDIMLYSCDSYMEENVAFPQVGSQADVAAAEDGVILGALQGKRCRLEGSADVSCFGECYGLTEPNDFEENAVEDDCDDIIPFWATTCSDIDECQNGVHGNCEGPFEEHCTLRPACGPNTKCTNMPGSWSCECLDGFKYTTESDLYETNMGCEDYNECEEADICGVNGQCRNTNGSYFCICTSTKLYNEATKKCTVGTCSAAPTLANAFTTSTPAISQYGESVTYYCNPGYHVASNQLSGLVPTIYGYSILTTFELTCDAYGEWGPQPFAACVPVYCGDPGVVPNIVRIGNDFRFEKEVKFDCPKGYGIKNGYDYAESFTLTCQADGRWTDLQYCEDMDECAMNPPPCGPSSKRCINNVGSYFCICALGYYQDDSDEDTCLELEPEAFPAPCQIMDSLQFCDQGTCTMDGDKAECRCDVGYEGRACDRPITTPCQIMDSLQFCDQGTCTMDGDKAECRCDAGYEGRACDRPITSRAFIMAAVAVALIGFLMLILITFYVCVTCRPRMLPAPAPFYGPGPIDPIYSKRPMPLRDLGNRRFPF